MDELGVTLITMGVLLLVGLITDAIGRYTPLPRVTLLILFGFITGPAILDLLPDVSGRWFPAVANMALLMIGFLLGEKLPELLSGQSGKVIFSISLSVVITTVCTVLTGLWLLDVPLEMALILSGIATSTAPAATVDVIREVRAKGAFARTLQGIVALDDAWGLMAFSLLFALALALHGDGDTFAVLLTGIHEIGGAVLLGVILGLPMAYVTGRIRPGEPTLAEALGFVFLCGGLAVWAEVSPLLAAMAMGATVAKLASHHQRPFHAIEHVEWPFMVLFFILAGASVELQALRQIGYLGIAYIVLRVGSRLAGVWLGSVTSHADTTVRHWMALALMPQAGVAVGMALVAAGRFPLLANQILAVAVSATIFFELVGPVLTRMALVKVGESEK